MSEGTRTRNTRPRPSVPDHEFGSTTTTWTEKTAPVFMGTGDERTVVATLSRTPETGWRVDEVGRAYVGDIGEHGSLLNAQYAFAAAYDNRHLRAARIEEARQKLVNMGFTEEQITAAMEITADI